MSTQMVWVHGNSGQLEVVDPHWGSARVFGWGLSLEGRVQSGFNDEEPWLHFHIPLSSVAVEAVRTPPKLRKVVLLLATDFNPPDWKGTYPPESSSYTTRYKYVLDEGGAFVHQIHLWDGAAGFFKKDDLLWQSPGIDSPVEHTLTLPQEAAIHWGLGVSLRIRFKNQMRLQKIQGDFAGEYGPAAGSEKPVPYFVPEEEPTTRSNTKSAIVHSVGAEFVPAGA